MIAMNLLGLPEKDSVRSVFVASWNMLGYYNKKTDLLNSFQAVIMQVALPDPATYVCYFYEQLEWTTAEGKGKEQPTSESQIM